MLSEQEKKELIRKRDNLNQEITSLRRQLNQINEKKESALDFEKYLKTGSGKAFARKRLWLNNE